MAGRVYVNDSRFKHIMMAMETTIGKDGVKYVEVEGTPEESRELEKATNTFVNCVTRLYRWVFCPLLPTGVALTLTSTSVPATINKYAYARVH